MTSPRTYTLAEKQAAIARTLAVGAAATSKELGISSGTLSCWAHKARRGDPGYALPAPEPAPAPAVPTPEPASKPANVARV